MAWAEYYRQQAAYYGQTLGQAQAHSQVRIYILPNSSAARSVPRGQGHSVLLQCGQDPFGAVQSEGDLCVRDHKFIHVLWF